MLLDQRVFCGVGNVYRCEVLWACELSPRAPVGELSESLAMRLVNVAARLLRANLNTAARVALPGVPGGLAVYGRSGQRCFRCSDTVVPGGAGEFNRLLYWCPGCQTRLAPQRPGRRHADRPAPRRQAVRRGTHLADRVTIADRWAPT